MASISIALSKGRIFEETAPLLARVGLRPKEDPGSSRRLVIGTQRRDTRLIVRAGIGYDVIDVPAATAAGIWVANVPDYCVDEVADHSLLLLLAATRRLDALEGLWRRERRWLVYDRLPVVHRPSDQVLGVVGMGRIGAAVARRAAAFGWRVLGYDAMLRRPSGICSVRKVTGGRFRTSRPTTTSSNRSVSTTCARCSVAVTEHVGV